MKFNLLNIISKNLSFFVIAFSSLCFFVLNVVLKDNLSANDYGLFSIFITYISLLSSFGLFGFEQTLLRTTKIKSKLEIEKNIIVPIFISLVASSFLGAFLIFSYYEIEMNFFLFFLLSVFVILTKISFNLYRLLSKFIISQFILNFWKISLTLLIIFYLGKFKISLSYIYLLSLIFFSLSISSFYGLIKKISFTKRKDTISLVKKSSLFFVSLLTISLLGYGDRFFIESRFGLEKIGDYFFYLNIFLFPFSLFQTYVGFKEIVTFKKSFSIKLLNNKILETFKYSVVFSFLLFLIFYMIENLNIYNLNISHNLDIIITLIFLGNIKIIYSLLSSVIGALSNDKMLFQINKISIFSILVLLPVINIYSTNIVSTIFFVIILWIIRCLIWYYEIKKYENTI